MAYAEISKDLAPFSAATRKGRHERLSPARASYSATDQAVSLWRAESSFDVQSLRHQSLGAALAPFKNERVISRMIQADIGRRKDCREHLPRRRVASRGGPRARNQAAL
jgi:hypothetical protein